jgi:hypothetical protein
VYALPQHPVIKPPQCMLFLNTLFSNPLSVCSSSTPCSQTPSVYALPQHPVLKPPQCMLFLKSKAQVSYTYETTGVILVGFEVLTAVSTKMAVTGILLVCVFQSLRY